MRLTQKKIEEIILGVLGPEGAPLLKYLYGKENVSEFDLATKTKRDIKVVRKQLYLLYNQNLVGFTRKKDKQKGWYVYYWTILPDSIRFNYQKQKKELLQRLQERLEEETKELFFSCPNTCVRLNFDQAMEFEFHCPECGDLIAQDDSEKKIAELKKKILLVQEELAKLKEKKKELKAKGKERKKVVRKKVMKAPKKKATKTKKKKASKKKASSKKTIKATKKKPVKKKKK